MPHRPTQRIAAARRRQRNRLLRSPECLESRSLMAVDLQLAHDVLPGNGSSNSRSLHDAADDLFFLADRKAWLQDAASQQLRELSTHTSSTVAPEVITIGDNTYYAAGSDLYVYNRSLQRSIRLAQVRTEGTGSAIANVNGTLYFAQGSGGGRLFKTDESGLGVVEVADIQPDTRPGAFAEGIDNLVGMGGTLFFTADDGVHGTELWKSDGTAEGTVQVADISSGGTGSSPGYLTNVGGTLFFSANDGSGAELWKSNGTAVGTELVKDIALGSAGSSPAGLVDIAGTLYFAADDGINGRELWVSNGSELGTRQVADIAVAPGSSNPQEIALSGGDIFFTADDGESGRELWTTDGLVTTRVADIWGGAQGSDPAELTDVDGTLYFRAGTFLEGVELWSSDGTEGGTRLVEDIAADGSSSPGSLAAVDGVLYFAATTDEFGRELWRTSDPLNAPNLQLPGVALYAEHDPAIAIAPDALAWDHDNPSFGGGSLRVTITAGAGVTDELGLLTSDRLTLQDDAIWVDGVSVGTWSGGLEGNPLLVTFNANATGDVLQLVARSVSYRAAGDDPTAGERIVSFELTDGVSSKPATAVTTVGVRREEDPPLLVIAEDPPPAFEDQAAITLENFVSDVSPAAVTYEIVGNTNPGLFAEQPSINAAGTLTYRSALNQFGTAEISVRAVSVGLASEPQAFVIRVASINDPPQIDVGTIPTYVEGTRILMLPEAVVSDVEQNFSNGRLDIWASAVMSIRHQGDGPGEIGFDGTTVRYEGLPFARLPGVSSDSLFIWFDASASPEAVQALVRNLTFEMLTDAPPESVFVFMILRDDWGSQVTRFTIPVQAIDDPFEVQFRASSSISENALPFIDLQASLSDPDGTDFRNGSIRLTTIENAQPGDRFRASSPHTSVTASGDQILYDGVVVGTFTTGRDFIDIQLNDAATSSIVVELLRALAFGVDDHPPPDTRTLQLEVADAAGFTRTSEHRVTIRARPDAPTLDTTPHVSLGTIQEDATAVPARAIAGLVSRAITDDDPGAHKGIAVTRLTHPTRGTWQYTLNGGVDWHDFGAVSSAAVRLLPATLEARVRFLPNLNFYGTPRMYYRAWDQTQGDAGGTFDLSGTGTGGRTPFSSAQEVATLTVTPVNDAPLLSPADGGTLGYTRGTPAVVLLSDAVVTDPDSANFGGGRLIVRVIDGHHAANRLVIGGGFVVEGDEIKLNGVLIGTRNAGGGEGFTRLEITFTSDATRGIVQRLVRGLKFGIQGAAPSGERAIELWLTDGDGGVSNRVGVKVNVG